MALEGHQIGHIVIMYDVATITRRNITDVVTRSLTKVEFTRKSDSKLLCTVYESPLVIDWGEGSFPAANKITQVQGLTKMEVV